MRLPYLVLMVVSAFFSADIAHSQLKNDIFLQPNNNVSSMNNKSVDLQGIKEELKPTKIPRLSSVIDAGKNSFVVLDGVVLKLGEVSEGHRLLEVGDQSALFSFEGKKIRIHMNGAFESNPPAKLSKGKM